MRQAISALLAIVLVGSASQARAEALGQITAFVAGDRMTWHTITMTQGDRTVATANIDQGARLAELYVQGHPEPTFSTRGMLSIDVRYLGPFAPDAEPLSVDVIHMPRGMGGPFWTSRDAPGPATIEVVELELWGRVGRLTATFAAELCFRRSISSATDPSNCRDVTGLIETEIFAE